MNYDARNGECEINFCFYNVILIAQITMRPITGLFVGRLINGEVWKEAVLT